MTEEKRTGNQSISSLPPWFHRMDEKGETPLSRALKSSYPFLVDLILREKSFSEETVEPEESSDPLQEAAYWGMEGMVDQLLDSGADASQADSHGKTPLMLAVCNGHRETVEALLEHDIDLNVSTPEGLTPIHWASLTGQQDLAETLIEHGAEVNPTAKTGCCPSPAATALFMGYYEMYDMLYEKGGKLY